MGWGIQLIDIDHDGRRDVLIVNGHTYPEIDAANLPAKYRQPRLFYWNVGGGKFKDMSDEAGPGIAHAAASRGSASGDLDNDGSLEVVIANLGERPSLLKNYGPVKNWLLVRCRGVECSRDAIGARVYVYLPGRCLSGEVQTGASFISQNDPRLHFGLGTATQYQRVEVQWPGGKRETFPGGKANRIIELKQGASKGTVSSVPTRQGFKRRQRPCRGQSRLSPCALPLVATYYASTSPRYYIRVLEHGKARPPGRAAAKNK
jgi:hypothetical protein